jgi:protein-tyrosine phosphatase
VLISFCRKEKSCVLATEILFYKEKKRKIIAPRTPRFILQREKRKEKREEYQSKELYIY